MEQKQRLDQTMKQRDMVASRSQAESYIRLGQVTVNGTVVTKPGTLVADAAQINLLVTEQYVSRAALKLASVARVLRINFAHKTVLDVGSSTGGFTQYALRQGAEKVIAVEVGKEQLHPTLRTDSRIELHEQTDIRQVMLRAAKATGNAGSLAIAQPDVVVIDASFVSLRDLLPHIATLCGAQTDIVAMVKPQFEAASSNYKHKGVIKNSRMRRDILRDFELWAKELFVVIDKADSEVAGSKGNLERFYLLRIAKHSPRRL